MGTDAELDDMLKALGGGFTVTWGTFTGWAIRHQADRAVLADESVHLVGRMLAAQVRASAFPGISDGDSVTAGGVAYKVRNPYTEEDGAVLLIQLEKA